MTSQRRLLQLSNLIHMSTTIVDSYINENNIPEPSFTASCPPVLELSHEADLARNAALEALDELREHLLGPVGSIMHNVTDLAGLASLHSIVNFGLGASLPADGTTTIGELAKSSNLHPDDAAIIVRHGTARNLFIQKENGDITHSAATRAIYAVPHLADTVETLMVNNYTAATHLCNAMKRWPGSQDITETAYNISHGTELSLWNHIAQDESRARKFAATMAFVQKSPGLETKHVLEYDWSRHANGTIVDLGGSHGAIASVILDHHPDLRVVVQDRPEVIAHAPRTTRENIDFMEHDFFAPQPLHGADVYFFRWILHDWPDKYVVKILQALRPALKPHARIVLMDSIVTEPGTCTPYQDRPVSCVDITMKMLCNAKERTKSDWRQLIGEADEYGRFKVVENLKPAGSMLGFVVVEWVQ